MTLTTMMFILSCYSLYLTSISALALQSSLEAPGPPHQKRPSNKKRAPPVKNRRTITALLEAEVRFLESVLGQRTRQTSRKPRPLQQRRPAPTRPVYTTTTTEAVPLLDPFIMLDPPDLSHKPDSYGSPQAPAYKAQEIEKPEYEAPKSSYEVPNPAYEALKPGYEAPKPAYEAPKLAYKKPAPVTNQKPIYQVVYKTTTPFPPSPAYSAPAASSPPAPAYNAPAAPSPVPTYGAYQLYSPPATKSPKAPAFTAPYSPPAPAYSAPTPALYSPPTSAYSTTTPAPYSPPAPAYSTPTPALYSPPAPAHSSPNPTPYSPPAPANSPPASDYSTPPPSHSPAAPSYSTPVYPPAPGAYSPSAPAYYSPPVYVPKPFYFNDNTDTKSVNQAIQTGSSSLTDVFVNDLDTESSASKQTVNVHSHSDNQLGTLWYANTKNVVLQPKETEKVVNTVDLRTGQSEE